VKNSTRAGRSLGCLDPQCVLCEHNPHRRCNVNFAPKYLVNDLLKAKCDAPIRVEIIDRATGVPLGEDIADLQLEARPCSCSPPSLRVWVTCFAHPRLAGAGRGHCGPAAGGAAAELASAGDVLCAPAWPPAGGEARTRLLSCSSSFSSACDPEDGLAGAVPSWAAVRTDPCTARAASTDSHSHRELPACSGGASARRTAAAATPGAQPGGRAAACSEGLRRTIVLKEEIGGNGPPRLEGKRDKVVVDSHRLTPGRSNEV